MVQSFHVQYLYTPTPLQHLSNQQSYWAVLSCGAVYYAVQGSSNSWVCGWNPKVWPFKWELLSSTFLWCCLLCCTRYYNVSYVFCDSNPIHAHCLLKRANICVVTKAHAYRLFSRDVTSLPVAILVYHFPLRNSVQMRLTSTIIVDVSYICTLHFHFTSLSDLFTPEG